MRCPVCIGEGTKLHPPELYEDPWRFVPCWACYGTGEMPDAKLPKAPESAEVQP